MIIEPIPSGPFQTNAYVVACGKTHRAVIIDPAPGSAEAILDYLTKHQLTADKILLTHSHWDHFGDLPTLVKQLALPVFVHRADAGNVENPGSDGLPLWIPIDGTHPTGYLEEGQLIPVGELQLKVIHTPGHSPGCVCFYEPTQGILLSGDTLFKGTIGNLSLPTADPDAMWPSLDKLARLPPNTRIYPGHGATTTIGAEEWLPNARQHFGS